MTQADLPSPSPHLQTPRLFNRAEMLVNRVRKNIKKRKKWAKRQGISCYRLYDRDIPELPLAIDLYENCLHASIFSSGHVLDDEVQEVGQYWLDCLKEAISPLLEIEYGYLKCRVRQKGSAQYRPLDRKREMKEVNEAGLTFLVNLTDYLDTGLFLDHRHTRERFGNEAKGKSILNLFAYTGSFTVYAAAAGAEQTVTVDSTATYLNWAKKHLEINQLEGDQHRFILSDVQAYLHQAQSRGERFDLVILDPPTFSNSKDTPTFDVRRHHALLFESLFHVLNPNGVVYFSTNARSFKLHPDLSKKWEIEEITHQTVPFDFQQKQPHRCWRCQSLID